MKRHATSLLLGIFILLIAPVFLAACAASAQPLAGQYSVKKKSSQADLMVTFHSGKYFASFRKQGDHWSKPDELVKCSDDDYQSLFGANWRNLDVHGLCAKDGPFGIFKIRKGAKERGHTFETGYFMFFGFGGGDVYRR